MLYTLYIDRGFCFGANLVRYFLFAFVSFVALWLSGLWNNHEYDKHEKTKPIATAEV